MVATDIIIDCDPGIDDALALALAVGSPELNLRAVTCVAGNRPVAVTQGNARGLLDLFGAPTVPVYAGAARPLSNGEARVNLVHGEDGLGGVELDRTGRLPKDNAVDVLVQALLDDIGTDLTLIAIGPLTNLALAEIRHPGVLARARAVLVMGGAIGHPGNVTPFGEFNFWADPRAAQVVAGSGARLRIFPLDVTSQAAMTPDWLRQLADRRSKSARALSAMLRVYAALDPLLHDPCPVAYLIDPTLFDGETGELQVEWRQEAEEGRSHFRPASCATTVFFKTNQEKLLEVIAARLATLP